MHDDGMVQKAIQQGCGLPVADLINSTAAPIEVRADLIEAALDLELRDGELIADDLAGARWR